MSRPTPATEPITPPAIVPGGVEGLSDGDTAAFEAVAFGHSLDVELTLAVVLLLEPGVA